MKALFIHTFLITTLLSLVGCGSKENSVKLTVSTSFAVTSAGYTGGLVVSGKNAIGQRFVKTVFGGSNLDVVLPDGTWDLSVVGWDGAAPSDSQAPFTGEVYCGKSTINLESSDTSASVTINNANCLTADFSGGTFINGAGSEINPLKVVTCGAFYYHSTASTWAEINPGNSSSFSSDFCLQGFHPLDLRSKTKSVKIIPINKNFDGSFSGQPASNPHCLTATTGAGIFNFPQEIPVAGLPFQVAFYEDGFCKNQKSFVLFPDGLKNGFAPKFDSILAYKGSDTTAPSISNRLIVSDNGINRGWSPFYGLMPDVKCTTGFCGDFSVGASSAKYNDGIYDFFIDVDYETTVNALNSPIALEFPAASDICTNVVPATGGSYTNRLVKTGCTYSAQNNKVTVMIKPSLDGTNCPAGIADICYSPGQKFVLDVDGEEKEIYFAGKRDYAPLSVIPVEFSHFPSPVRQRTDSGVTACSMYLPSNVSVTGNNTLEPVLSCRDTNSAIVSTLPYIFAKASYDSTQKNFRVREDASKYGSILFNDASNGMSANLAMLPPSDRTQKDVLGLIFETIGGSGILNSFKYEQQFNQNNNGGDDSQDYGSIRKVREMFSPDGPGGLFDRTISCASTVASQSLNHTDKDGTHFYEVSVVNISGSSADAKHLRHLSYCQDTQLVPGSCPNSPGAGGDNSGRFQKQMNMKKDGVLIGVMLFDCSSKRGSLESKEVNFEDGKYRKHKEFVYWNTQDMTYSRFETYSRYMESTSSAFTSFSRHERKYEKVHKADSGWNNMTGRVYKHTYYVDPTTSALKQNMKALRFKMINPIGNWDYAYSYYDLNESGTADFFAASGPYSSMKIDTLPDTHFCGTTVSFPLPLAADCSIANATYVYPFTLVLPAPVHSMGNGFSGLASAAFDTIMAGGFLAGW